MIGLGRQIKRSHVFVTLSASLRSGEIVTRKGTTAVVALEAVISRRSPVLQDSDICYLSALRSTVDDAMAFVATNTLPGSVIGVSKDRFEVILRDKRTAVRCDLMANITAADLALGRMACVAIIMGIDPGWDSLSRSRRLVAERAALCRASGTAVMSAVLKLHIETFLKLGREGTHRRVVRLDILMADRAKCPVFVRYRVVDKLVQVTPDAGFMARKLQLTLLSFTPMTSDTVEFLVLRNGV